MASVKSLKKDVHQVLGDIIEAIYIHELTIGGATPETTELIEDALNKFDELIVDINAKNVENKKAHYKAVFTKLENIAGQLVERINTL